MGLGAAIAGGLTALGVGAETAGILAPVLLGSAVGTVGSAITGGNIGEGALLGGITGGFGELGGVAGDALGIGAGAGDILGGTAGGLVGAGITGGNPLTGALTGAAGGAFSAAGGAGGIASALGLGDAGAAGGAGIGDASLGADTSTDNLSQSIGTGATGPTVTNSGVSAIPSVGGGDSGITALTGSPLTAQPINSPNLSLNLPSLDSTVATATGGGSGITALGGSPLTPQSINTPNLSQSFTAAPSGVGTGGGSGNSITNAINNPSGSNILSALGNNLGPLIAGGGLLYNLTNQGSVPGQAELTGAAQQQLQQGQQLESYINSGTLPPGAQAAVQQGANAAKAEVRSRFAALGLSGSSMEAGQLAEIDQNVATQSFQIADQLLQQGISETGLATGVYESLLQFNEQQQQQTGQAIGNFAAALAGSGAGRNITINTGTAGA